MMETEIKKVEIITRPIDRWPRPFTARRKTRPFPTPWDKTVRLLKYELLKLGASSALIQLACQERDISVVTGLLKTDNVAHPGVILAADTRHGPLKWMCDDCTGRLVGMQDVSPSGRRKPRHRAT